MLKFYFSTNDGPSLFQERKRAEAEAPMLEAQRQEEERQARFRALPEWKQKLIMQKQGMA